MTAEERRAAVALPLLLFVRLELRLQGGELGEGRIGIGLARAALARGLLAAGEDARLPAPGRAGGRGGDPGDPDGRSAGGAGDRCARADLDVLAGLAGLDARGPGDRRGRGAG